MLRLNDLYKISIILLVATDKTVFKTTDEKTLLVLGATGTGKSTFIDALFNYLAGVSYRDDFRLSIIDKNIEEISREDDQVSYIKVNCRNKRCSLVGNPCKIWSEFEL